MDFYVILQDILSEKGLSIPAAARACGVSDSTLRSIITRKNKTVALEVAMKISKGLDVSLERLNGSALTEKAAAKAVKNRALHSDEEKLLQGFRQLNEAGRAYILQTMEMALMSYRKEEGKKEA